MPTLIRLISIFLFLTSLSFANYILHTRVDLSTGYNSQNVVLDNLKGATLEWAIEVDNDSISTFSNSVNMRGYEAVNAIFRITGGTPYDGDYSFLR